MSKLFSRLRALPQQKNPVAAQKQAQEVPVAASVVPPVTPVESVIPVAVDPKINLVPITSIIGIAATVVMLSLLGLLSFNVAAIKNQTLVGIDKRIHQEQNQILVLNKKLVAMESSVDDRVQKSETAAKEMNNGLEHKFDDLSNNVASKLDQTSTNMNHVEAVLQSNIDELNAKISKLQTATDQTKAVSSN